MTILEYIRSEQGFQRDKKMDRNAHMLQMEEIEQRMNAASGCIEQVQSMTGYKPCTTNNLLRAKHQIVWQKTQKNGKQKIDMPLCKRTVKFYIF